MPPIIAETRPPGTLAAKLGPQFRDAFERHKGDATWKGDQPSPRRRSERRRTRLRVNDGDLANLRESGLTDETIRANGLWTAGAGDAGKLAEILNCSRESSACLGGLVFEYRDLDGNSDGFARVRPHFPRMDKAGKKIKYEQPKGSGLRSYFPAGCLEPLRNSDGPVYITEGEKKALLLAQEGFTAVGLGGVWCGCKRNTTQLIDDLVALPLKGRQVFIVFDYDTKPETRRKIAQAQQRLAMALRAAGAKKVCSLELPPGAKGAKQGIDDFIVNCGKEAFLKLVEATTAREKGDARAGSMADVMKQIEGVSYLVDDWVPKGMLAMLLAPPGMGKSAFALFALSRPIIVGRSTKWFSGEKGPAKPGYVLWCDTEGSAAITVQRIIDWKLPAERIKVPFADDPLCQINLTNEEHLTQIETIITDYNVPLVVIDSLRGAHDGDENSSRVSQVLQRLAQIAERTKAAIVIIHHTRKMQFDEEMSANSARGSNAHTAMVRVQLGIDKPDPKGEWCRVQMLKENLGLKPQPVGFKIGTDSIEFGIAPEKPSGSATNAPARAEAAAWLRDVLSQGPVRSSDIIDRAREEGLCLRTLRAAKKAIGVRADKLGGPGEPWEWSLPPKV